MKSVLATNIKDKNNIAPIEGMRVGKIISVTESGGVLVDIVGIASGPVVARITTSAKSAIIGKGNPVGREVLVAFADNDSNCPVIVDTMYSLIEEISESELIAPVAEEAQEVTIDGKRITFDADNEIVLKCGKSSITLTRAGKILIKGEYVLSQSTGENKIRGGSVAIN